MTHENPLYDHSSARRGSLIAPAMRAVRMWRTLIRQLSARDRRRLLVAVFAMTLSSLGTAAIPVVVGTVVDSVYPGGRLGGLYAALVPLSILVVVYALINVADIVRHQQIHVVTTNFAAEARAGIARCLLRWPLERFQSNTDGAIYSRASRGVEGAERLIKLGSADLLPAILVATFAVIIAAFRYGWLGAVMAIVIPTGFSIVAWQITSQDGVRIHLKQSRERIDGWVTSCLLMLKTIRTSGTEAYFDSHVEAEVEQQRKTEVRHHIAMSLFDSGKAANEVFWMIVTVFTAIWLDLAQTPGDLAGIILLYLAVTKPLRELHRVIDESSEASLNTEDLIEDLGAPLDKSFEKTPDRPATATSAQTVVSMPTTSPIRNNGDAISFTNVTYGYRTPSGATRPVLDDVTLSIAAGERVGLVGASGSGKSTLLDLIERLHHHYTGEIAINGIDLTDLPRRELVDLVAYVGQKPALFPGTIRDNLIMGRPEITEDDLRDACLRANIAAEIEGLEHGYDHWVAQKGDNFSGGQQQRLCIARALLHTPPIVLLDEPTSALDGPSQSVVQRAIDGLTDVTMLVVAHRLNTLEAMDRILVLHEGRIVEDGTYADLASADGAFASMLRNETWDAPSSSPVGAL